MSNRLIANPHFCKCHLSSSFPEYSVELLVEIGGPEETGDRPSDEHQFAKRWAQEPRSNDQLLKI